MTESTTGRLAKAAWWMGMCGVAVSGFAVLAALILSFVKGSAPDYVDTSVADTLGDWLALPAGLATLAALTAGACGVVAWRQSKGLPASFGFAGKAIRLALLTIALVVIAGLLLPAKRSSSRLANAVLCLQTMRNLWAAMETYAQEHNGRLPEAGSWCDTLQPLVIGTNAFQCRTYPGSGCAYAFNRSLGGTDRASLATNVVVFFERWQGWNANGGPETAAPHQRHHHARSPQFVRVLLSDGTVKSVPLGELGAERWKP